MSSVALPAISVLARARTQERPVQPAAPTPEVAALEATFRRLQALPDDTPGARASVPGHVWNETLLAPARALLERPGKRFRARLVGLGYALAGGAKEAPAQLTAALEIIHAGSLIIDDIEDGSAERRGIPAVHTQFGTPLALNTGNWMYFLPFELVDQAGLSDAQTLRLTRAIQRTMYDCHRGQALDIGVRVGSVRQSELPGIVSATTALKTGALTDLAITTGAIAANASNDRREALSQFGRRLGCALQMLDDLGNLRSADNPQKRFEDLKLCRPTWMWAWASESMGQAAFTMLQARAFQVRKRAAETPADNPDTLRELDGLARDLLSAAGANRRALISAELQKACGDLKRAMGDHPAFAALKNTIKKLEQSYG